MAKLEGVAGNVGKVWLSLAPIINVDNCNDSNAYSLQLYHNDVNIMNRTLTVKDWFLQHDSMWVFARTFIETPNLVQTVLPIDVWRTGTHMPAQLYESCEYIHAILWGNKSKRKLAVRLFIQDEHDKTLFKTFFIQTSVLDAARFGLEFEKEIIEACPNWASERAS